MTQNLDKLTKLLNEMAQLEREIAESAAVRAKIKTEIEEINVATLDGAFKKIFDMGNK